MPHEPQARRRLLTVVTTVVMLAAMIAGGAQAQAADGDGGSPASAGPTGPLATEMDRMLALQPGGIQVSDNAMAWEGGVVVVWPSPGDAKAPAGLGANVRADVVDSLGLQELITDGLGFDDPETAPQSAAATAAGTWKSCSPGYYCFYTGTNYDGSRFQFSSTCSGNASSWGFNDTTSSWVNRNYSKRVYAYDYSGGAHLWTMGPGAMDANVGAGDSNRMSYWTCTNV